MSSVRAISDNPPAARQHPSVARALAPALACALTFALMAALTLLLVPAAHAQNSAILQGRIVSSAGAPVTGAQLGVVNNETKQQRGT